MTVTQWSHDQLQVSSLPNLQCGTSVDTISLNSLDNSSGDVIIEEGREEEGKCLEGSTSKEDSEKEDNSSEGSPVRQLWQLNLHSICYRLYSMSVILGADSLKR